MRLPDLLTLSIGDLWQRKLRSVLTLAGIVLGTTLLLLVTAGGVGVMQAVDKQYRSNTDLRRIAVYSHYGPSAESVPEDERTIAGEMSEARRQRLEAALLRRHAEAVYTVEHPITPELLDEWTGYEHVELVQPEVHLQLLTEMGGEPQRVTCGGFWDPELLDRHLVAGRGLSAVDADEVVIHEYLAYLWGAVNESDVESLLGRTIHLEHRGDEGQLAQSIGWMQGSGDLFSISEARQLDAAVSRLAELVDELDLPEEHRAALKKAFGEWRSDSGETPGGDSSPRSAELVAAGDFRIVGVYRDPDEGDQHPALHRLWNAELLFSAVKVREFSDPVILRDEYSDYSGASVLVDSELHVREVQDRMNASGVETHSLVDFIENVHLRIRFITLILAGLAFAALVVAGLGIANTMTMSVLERSREIGVMKAVGARDHQVLLLFLTEGLWLGLLGSGLGIVVGAAVAQLLTNWVKGIVEGEFGRAFDQPMFAFPPMYVAGIVAVVLAVTVTASLLPAVRAARIDPILMLKSE